VLRRVGEPLDEMHASTPQYGVQIRAGAHGEHRLTCSRAYFPGSECRVSLRDPAVLWHTDVPEARHAPIQLAPGTWAWNANRELSENEIIVQVRD
jgi:hypothetical protein